MKRQLFNLIIPIIAFLAITQNAFAQWNSSTNPIFPANLNANVGIGTNSPAPFRLYVRSSSAANNATVKFSDALDKRMIFVPRLGAGGYNPLSQAGDEGIFWSDNSTFNVSAGLVIAPHKLSAAGIRLDANGNVGVGVSSPLQKLHVESGIMISGPNPGGGPMLLFSKDPSLQQYPAGHWGIEYVPHASDAYQSGLNFWQPWGNPAIGVPQSALGTPGNHYLFLTDKEGKVGMGVDPNPANCPLAPNGPFPAGYRLYVREGILTEKLKIANYCSANWADYVFAPDYKLKPLSEVEAFVKSNRHLPNVPSAQDIENDGLDVADMLARQMEKIEELMLHTIELNKRVEKLEAENAVLKQQPATIVKH